MRSAADVAATLQEILDAREARWLRRLELCRKGPLLTLTLNLPGPDKNLPRWNALHRELTLEARADLRDRLLRFEEYESPAGSESHFVTALSPVELKRYAVDLEERSPAGRLLDADVMDTAGNVLGRGELGLPARLCLCCGEEAKACAREGRHSPEELLNRADALLGLRRSER